ncbi:urease accessory protein D-like isoform X2 [Andrographis paniculata]|uniref:urease accessory protein D-like isoform X2 n=1 Tax=Andrographis paniculata TaxID=175694 RepID=UPI0021E8B171|nr:urease accessory protein D-like isoform X2 [Andrographis paniculata]
MDRGKLVVERVQGKSTLTRCFSKYPFKFINPNKVGGDAVWVYTITYGGGIVSGDSIDYDIEVGDDCMAVLTTQSSTKVYKSIGSKCSKQSLEAIVGSSALLALIPDPVTCFSTARYSQMQVFKLMPQSSLLVVDWITSGRYETGEKWAFSHYKSTNCILLQGNEPLFLDTVLLEKGSCGLDQLQHFHAIAMIIILGPKLKLIQDQIQKDVKKLMSRPLFSKGSSKETKPSFLASCSTFGLKGQGVVVRVASTTTESIYNFLQQQLAGMEILLGAPPYQ